MNNLLQPRSVYPQEAGTPISVDEAHARFQGEWVIMKVTATDEYDVPTHGEILAHKPSYGAIWRKFAKIAPPTERSGNRYYIFSAHPRIRSGEQLQQAVHEAAARGEFGKHQLDAGLPIHRLAY